jgi:LysM repeat protein
MRVPGLVSSVATVVALVSCAAFASAAPPTAKKPTVARAPAHTAPLTHAYVVKAGDGGWFHLAQTHGITLPQLLTANHAKAETPVRVGQTIQMPAAPRKHAPSASPAKPTGK